ncbi:MAG: hypothetical protein PHY09_16750 [Desulfuromonadaceae bacterium]|nr:hypothetical protein [Desulfuromonadaceae bacterium]MDD5107564.1 hypothetical protein [Desulfuromonadaceae bacterium]
MDLLSQDNVDQFRAAMRSVTDTFHKTPVILRRKSGEEIELLAGWKPDDTGSYGGVDGEAYVQEAHRETVERYLVSFNRDYLAAKELIDPATDKLLISEDDKLVFKGKRFVLVKITDKGVFRGVPILAQLTVQR